MHSRLVIRADADSRMGTGHVMRCIALGQAWQDAGGEVVFLTCCKNTGLLRRLYDEKFRVIELDAASDFQTEIIRLKSAVSNPWLVLDGYHFDLPSQRAVRAAGFKLLLIDDYNHLPEYECDILLNQNINAPELHYCVNLDAQQLLGTQYALLRREFRRLKPEERTFPAVAKNILVTLGGADPDNVTLKVVRALEHLDIPQLQIKIIVGPANLHLNSLRQAVDCSTADCRLLTDVKDMPGLMQWADLTVSAAGSTCWELCCLGVPFVTLVLADNQRGLAGMLASRGTAFCLGENPSADEMTSEIKKLVSGIEPRICCSESGKELVDGSGTDRVLCSPAVESGLDIFKGRLSLHPAAESDMELFWKWANDPSVRVNCYNKEPIALETHRQWFAGKLASEDVLMLILKLDGVPAGQIRYDRDGDAAGISFSIDKRFRGLGLGRKIIEQSVKTAFSQLKVERIRAEVFQTNAASRAAFIKTGFELAETCEIKGVPSFVFVQKRS